MGNETCPPDPIGVNGQQTDLNAPVPAAATGDFVQLHNLQTFQPLCEYGLTPAITVGLLMKLLANHFSSPDLIMAENLKQYVWSPNSADSKIRIVQNTRFDPQQAGLLPALVVQRGPTTSKRMAIDDRAESTDPNEFHQGSQTYVRFNTGALKVFCIAEADGEVEDLADEVFDTISFLSPALRGQGMPFHDFQAMSLGAMGVLDGLGNRIGVPIDIECVYEYAWAIKPLAPVLKTLNLQIPI